MSGPRSKRACNSGSPSADGADPTRRTIWPAIACALAIWAGSSPAPARSAPGPGRAETSGGGLIRIGRLPALPPSATFGGDLPSGTRLHVTIALRPRDPAALADYARAVSTPGSGRYGAYLTPPQFARRFGATAAKLSTVRRSLRAHGLNPGPTSANSLSIPVFATVGRLQRAFSLSFSRIVAPGHRMAIASNAAPSLDAAAAGSVQAVIGLDTIAAPSPRALRASRTAGPSMLARPHVVTGGPQACAQAQASAPTEGAYTSDQIASAYGFPGLYQAGDGGAGVTIAVYELEPDDPNDIAAYQACYATQASVSYVSVDGGTGSGSGSGEAALDIESVIGLAPAAKLLVYQGPNSDSGSPGSGPYDVYSKIINQDLAKVISVSWGQCETALGAGAVTAENTLFEQAAVQGQTIVAASGDNGSEDCLGSGAGGDTRLAVDDPASQPYVTGVGGTTLNAIGPRPVETAWNSATTPPDPAQSPGAGGGGNSSFWPMPASQRTAPSSLQVIGSASSGGPCGNPGGYCREVPDVSGAADPATGSLIYYNGSGAEAGQPTQWQGIGGTSAATPIWAALIALSDASPACGGIPLGFANPALYRAAGGAYTADFNDVVAGDNDLTATNGGIYGAGIGYDLATGLGTPNAASLAADLCADTLRTDTPPAQRSTLHAPISLRLRSRDARGANVAYHAVGLPPGLSLSSASGRISGRPRRRGAYTVTVDERDAAGSVSRIIFQWTVGGPPTVSGAVISGLLSGRPKLTLTVTAGRGAPAIQGVSLRPAHGLRFASKRRVSVSAAGVKRTRFSDRLVHGSLAIGLRAPVSKLRVTIAYPALRGGPGLLPGVRLRHTGVVPDLSVSVLDVSGATSQLSIAPRRGR